MKEVFGTERPIVGMVHLDPLPGAPRFAGARERIHDRARADADALVAGGVDGIIVENFGDAPFYPEDVPSHVVAEFTAVASTVSESVPCPVGVNVLRNDATAALGIAAAIDGDFIRVNIHTGARVTDQGVLEGRAHETMRLRERIGADVAVLADIDVKHSAPVTSAVTGRNLVGETVERGLADAVIVSGVETGAPTDQDAVATTVETVRDIDDETPVFVGSGVTPDTIEDFLDIADGVIVGTALKEEGVTTNPVDRHRVETLVQAASSG